MKVNANAHGWIGRNNVNVSVRENGSSSSVDGWVGNDSVNLRQDSRNISGSISGINGYTSVNLSLQKSDSGSRINGWFGNDSLNLTDRVTSNGEHRITGNLGMVNISLNRRDRGDSSTISGYLTRPGSLSENVNVTVSGGVPAQLEALYPVLSYLGPAMHLALAG